MFCLQIHLPLCSALLFLVYDECLSTPCLHGGVCSDDLYGFICDCSHIDYEGAICESGECYC